MDSYGSNGYNLHGLLKVKQAKVKLTDTSTWSFESHARGVCGGHNDGLIVRMDIYQVIMLKGRSCRFLKKDDKAYDITTALTKLRLRVFLSKRMWHLIQRWLFLKFLYCLVVHEFKINCFVKMTLSVSYQMSWSILFSNKGNFLVEQGPVNMDPNHPLKMPVII